MSNVPVQPVDVALDVTKAAQLAALIKENQLVTALVCFLLWQTGAFLTISSELSGVMC